MRIAIGITLTILLVSGIAAADSPFGRCNGGTIVATVGLAQRDNNGDFESIPSAELYSVFGAAECECNSDDIVLDVVVTQALPQGTAGSAELWVGDGCDANTAARTTAVAAICEKQGSVDFSHFVEGGGSTNGHIYLPFSTQALYAPVTHVCPANSVSNGLYLLLFSGGNSSPSGAPYASCSLELTEEMVPPGAAQNVTVTPGDGAVAVSWTASDAPAPPPLFYQVLCADDAEAPAIASVSQAAYSVCEGSNLEQRALPGLASSPGVASSPASGLLSLDHTYVCSDEIPVGAAGGSARITGLSAGKSYQFLVVAIDLSGNATPSAVVSTTLAASPPPAASHGGGCSAAGGGGAPTGALLLVCLALMIHRARRRAM